MNYLYLLCINLFFYFIVFLIAKIVKKHSIIDIFWGLSFLNLATILYFFISDKSIQETIIYGLIVIWSIRLSIHLFVRNAKKPEDYRYVDIKNRLIAKYPKIPLFIKEYVYIYIMQAVLSLIISTVFIIYFTNNIHTNNIIFIIGVIVTITGFFFEFTADYQLKQYMKTKSTPVLSTGLYKYTRHPNYFGEVLVWYGLFIISLNSSLALVGFISPLLINLLIYYVSGIPLLEKNMMKREAYVKYAEVTPKFIPFIKGKR